MFTYNAEEYTVGTGDTVDLFILFTSPTISCFHQALIFVAEKMKEEEGKEGEIFYLLTYSSLEWRLMSCYLKHTASCGGIDTKLSQKKEQNIPKKNQSIALFT